MEYEKYIIPRNVINQGDIFPIDFITTVNIDKRQIPYLIVGAGVTAIIVSTGTIIPASLIVGGKVTILNCLVDAYTASVCGKAAIGVITCGMSYLLSIFKIQNQHLEQLLVNCIDYNKEVIKFKINKRK